MHKSYVLTLKLQFVSDLKVNRGRRCERVVGDSNLQLHDKVDASFVLEDVEQLHDVVVLQSETRNARTSDLSLTTAARLAPHCNC